MFTCYTSTIRHFEKACDALSKAKLSLGMQGDPEMFRKVIEVEKAIAELQMEAMKKGIIDGEGMGVAK